MADFSDVFSEYLINLTESNVNKKGICLVFFNIFDELAPHIKVGLLSLIIFALTDKCVLSSH